MTKVYHGSLANFKQFDYNKVGTNGTSEGFGFYFTDSLNIAQGYAGESGYIYEVNFKGIKPLSIVKKTITKSKFKKFILALGVEYISQWGDIEFEGFNKVLNMALNDYDYSESDVDLIGGVLNVMNQHERILNLLHHVLGYDSIIVDSPEWGGNQIIYISLIQSSYEIVKVYSRTEQTF